MKKLIALFLLVLIGVVSSYAQPQIDHVKRTYIGSDGKLYINKALPVYLWLTTSPTDKSEGILLKSEQESKYTNPMYFDTEGLNNIKHEYAVDQNTKEVVNPPLIVNYDVYVDGVAPYSSSTFSPAPKYVSGGVIYYGKGLTVDLHSTDAVSGIENIHYSINAENYKDYTSTIAMDEEKTYVFKYYGSDNVGNAENSTTKNYIVDLNPPKTNHSVSEPKLGDIISPKADITLSFSDNLSGVKNTKYDFDSRNSNYYSVPITLWGLNDGNHSLTYYSTDNVLNKEPPITYNFYLDKIAPVVTQEIVGDQYHGNYKFISSRTNIKLSATDNKAGVDKIFYSIDATGQNTYNNEFLIPSTDGIHTIGYWGVDKVTNLAERKYLTVYMDNSTPKTYITYGNPQFFDRDTLFINQNTPLTLVPYDAAAGIQKTEYSINSGGNNTYSSSFKIPEEGYKTIDFYSTDKVNNQEGTKTSHCLVDNTPPIIYIKFSIDPIGKKGNLNIYPSYTRMYVAATDIKVGTASIQYSVNGSAMREYSSPYTLDPSEIPHFLKKNQKYTIKVQAKDKLGNQSDQSIEFYIAN